MPVPRSARTVVLFGGTFDPPHRAHIDVPRRVRDRLFGRGAWLVYVPAARSPHKSAGPLASNEDRIGMLRLATARVARCVIWTDEIDRARRGPSYWIHTLGRAMRAMPPGAQLRFLIGSDQAVAFHRWRDYRQILILAEPVVMLRPPHRSIDGVLRAMRKTGAWSTPELEQWEGWIDDADAVNVSSTRARSSFRVHAADDARLIAPSVRAYIKRRALYAD